MTGPSRARLTLYGRPGCHLCEEALAVIERVRLEIPCDLEQVDITTDEDLHRSCFERIPVLLVDGEELCELFVPEGLLRERLGEASGRVGSIL